MIAHLAFIDEVVRAIARRHHLSTAEADDLASIVRLKLVADDYAALRQFEGRSSLRTYLRIVIQRVFLDERRASWGSWRPSAQAKRLGPMAITFERLLVRDGLPFDSAARALEGQGISLTADALAAIARQLPSRLRRRHVEMSAAADVADPRAHALETGGEEAGLRAEEAIQQVLVELPPEERLVLRLHFMEGLRLSDVARLLSVEQKPLYRQVERSLRSLRRGLESRGVGPDLIDMIVKTSDFDVVRAFGDGPAEGNDTVDPSVEAEARSTAQDSEVGNV